MGPWWKLTKPRQEVREGRSFNPGQFALARRAAQKAARLVPKTRRRLRRGQWRSVIADVVPKAAKPRRAGALGIG